MHHGQTIMRFMDRLRDLDHCRNAQQKHVIAHQSVKQVQLALSSLPSAAVLQQVD